LGISGIGYDEIRADEAADSGIVVARPVVVEAGSVQPLAGKLLFRRDCAGAGTGRAEGRLYLAVNARKRTGRLMSCYWQAAGILNFPGLRSYRIMTEAFDNTTGYCHLRLG
jgi:hypothetical protein